MEEKTEIVNSDLTKIQPFSGMPSEMAPNLLSEGKALQKVETKYTTAIAVQKPRSITRLLSNVLEEASMAGAAFYYGWIVKTKKGPVRIEGPSIDLAMCVARHYGNCALDIEASETPTHYMMKGYLIDLESGFTCPRLFRQRKSQSMGMEDMDRQEDIIFQIGQSKAIRNAIIRAMPRWLTDRAIEVAKEAELKSIKAESPVIAQAKVLSFFKEYGVSQESIESKLNKKADNWSAEDIAELRASATALKEGRIRADELFPVDNGETAPELEPKPESKKKKERKKREKKEKKEEQKEDPIRAAYLPLPEPEFTLYVKTNLQAISFLPEKYQTEIRAIWDGFHPDEPYPESSPDEAVEEPETPEAETETEKILRLVPGAEFDQTMDQPVVPCPERDMKKVASNWCKQSCEGKEKCDPWAEYDGENAE